MMDNNFSPYDALIELNERMLRLEKKHNQLARDYMQTERDLTEALRQINTLQRGHLALSELVNLTITRNNT